MCGHELNAVLVGRAFDDIESRGGLLSAQVVVNGDAVEASVLKPNLLDGQCAHFIPLLHADTVPPIHQGDVVLVPHNAGCGVSLDGALEGHGLALLHDAVVRDVVELGAVGAVGAPRAGVSVALACEGRAPGSPGGRGPPGKVGAVLQLHGLVRLSVLRNFHQQHCGRHGGVAL